MLCRRCETLQKNRRKFGGSKVRRNVRLKKDTAGRNANQRGVFSDSAVKHRKSTHASRAQNTARTKHIKRTNIDGRKKKKCQVKVRRNEKEFASRWVSCRCSRGNVFRGQLYRGSCFELDLSWRLLEWSQVFLAVPCVDLGIEFRYLIFLCLLAWIRRSSRDDRRWFCAHPWMWDFHSCGAVFFSFCVNKGVPGWCNIITCMIQVVVCG